jgi:MurNAc alpha-1-phosphate uridylyltransferase
MTDSNKKSLSPGSPFRGRGGEVGGMIFAAGVGSRFKPWTDKHPKALAVINGKSLLQRNVQYLQQFGITDVVVNVHHFAEQVIEAIENNKGWGSRIRISDESLALLETGGGLKKAAPLFSCEHILIINADIVTDLDLSNMIHYHKSQDQLATIAITNRQTSRYFLFDEELTLCGWRNTNTGEEKISRQANKLTPMAFSGIHLIEKRLISLITKEGKFSMVDVYLELAQHLIIKGFDHSGSKFIDVGKPESIAIASSMFP